MKNSKQPELCIPRVSVGITRETIFRIFCKLKWGYIERINEIPLKTKTEYKRIIIRIKWNLVGENNQQIYERVMIQNEPVFVVYDMPFYLKIVKNQAPQLTPPPAYKSPESESESDSQSMVKI